MVQLSVNAPDWDSLYAARMARDILWGDERNIPLREFPAVTQSLVDVLSKTNGDSPSRSDVIQALLRYRSLLHYTSITHSCLTAIVAGSGRSLVPTSRAALAVFLRELSVTFLHPRFIIFLPIFVLHIPAYVAALTLKRALASPREEETYAQFKAVGGVLGATGAYALVAKAMLRPLASCIGRYNTLSSNSAKGENILSAMLQRMSDWMVGREGPMKYSVCFAATWIICGRLLSGWHNILVGDNYRQLKRLIASYKILVGLLSSQSASLSEEALAPYTAPPRPAANPFIKTIPNPVNEETSGPADVLAPPLRKLIRLLLAARTQATLALTEFFMASNKPRTLHPLLNVRVNELLARERGEGRD